MRYKCAVLTSACAHASLCACALLFYGMAKYWMVAVWCVRTMWCSPNRWGAFVHDQNDYSCSINRSTRTLTDLLRYSFWCRHIGKEKHRSCFEFNHFCSVWCESRLSFRVICRMHLSSRKVWFPVRCSSKFQELPGKCVNERPTYANMMQCWWAHPRTNVARAHTHTLNATTRSQPP